METIGIFRCARPNLGLARRPVPLLYFLQLLLMLLLRLLLMLMLNLLSLLLNLLLLMNLLSLLQLLRSMHLQREMTQQRSSHGGFANVARPAEKKPILVFFSLRLRRNRGRINKSNAVGN